jgi:glycosyltransferase involved in cell wall biosynthesis
VIGGDMGSIGDILGEGALAVVPPEKRALATALSGLLDDEEIDRVGVGGRRRYDAVYRPDAHVNRLLEVYRGATDAG